MAALLRLECQDQETSAAHSRQKSRRRRCHGLLFSLRRPRHATPTPDELVGRKRSWRDRCRHGQRERSSEVLHAFPFQACPANHNTTYAASSAGYSDEHKHQLIISLPRITSWSTFNRNAPLVAFPISQTSQASTLQRF
ncbi:hypothetical protein BDW22DRAFT_602832 [Trametopsis cervina]|nr:hypothetical protein BDW22DRAFT_602832 [Trametopsis cervina]